MSTESLLNLIIASEAVIMLVLMTFNAYFLTQRPIIHYIKEIYFINGRKFRQAWYLVISATTFFLLKEIMDLLDNVGVVIPKEQAQMGSQIFTLSFGTLIILAFAIVFSIFLRYVRKLPASRDEIHQLISRDMRSSSVRDDVAITLDTDLSRVSDITSGRQRLGSHISLSHYRALTTGFVAYMEQKWGHMGDAVLYAVGRITSKRATTEILKETKSRERAVEQIFSEIRNNGIGIPEVRQFTDDRVDVVMFENAPSAGVQPAGRPICHYQAGMFSGIYEALYGRPTSTKETKCWGLGDRLCEFRVEIGKNP